MTAFDLATETARRPAPQRLIPQAMAAVSRQFRAWQNRRAFHRLSDLSDVELRDIGLTRADLHVAGAGPLGLDPTARLRDMVEARAMFPRQSL